MKKHLILLSLLFTTAFPTLFGQTLQVGMRWEYLEDQLFWLPQLLQPIISVETLGNTVIQEAARLPKKPFRIFDPSGRIIRTWDLGSESGVILWQINGEAPKGIYLASLIAGGKAPVTIRFSVVE